MKQRTLQLFQLFLLVYALYAVVKYSGHERFLVSLACLVTAFVVGKVETRLKAQDENRQPAGHAPRRPQVAKTTSQALDWLLRSKNVLLLTDAVQCLLQDLGLVVSPSPASPSVDRIVSIPGMEVKWGLIILGDVEDLREDWAEWEGIAAFDKGKQGKQRPLIICSNSVKTTPAGQQKYTTFSGPTKRLLSTKGVVAMTTLTLCKIYLLCKKKGVDIKTIFQPIQTHGGGVFQVERPQ
ncbi:MAG: hypothetical protein SWQ30_13005 [Thermodesulfobacteriota bacterium]|nr:hypothetical protein [Thermodesulfobacteriota bacterium]